MDVKRDLPLHAQNSCMSISKKVIVSVTNDLSTDQRVHKICSSLSKKGYDVLLLGRQLKNSKALQSRTYSCHRFNLWFTKGFLFYANYNLCLFFYLLRNQHHILLANDLDTLAANYFASKLKGSALVYDSHEYFTEVPELIDRAAVKKFWESFEAYLIPKLKYAYTVSSKIAEVYQQKYNVKFQLVRNFPIFSKPKNASMKKQPKVVLYQGALNVGRGLEELIDAMQYLDEVNCWIVGGGDIEMELKEKVSHLKLNDRVQFFGKIPWEELTEITAQASIGVSLEKESGLNYTYALPNKIFDYIHQGIPVLYSPLVEVKEVLTDYTVGQELIAHEAKQFAQQIEGMLGHKEYDFWQKECRRAAEDLNWQHEEQTLFTIFGNLEPN